MDKLNTTKLIHSVEKPFIKLDLPIISIGDNVKIGLK